MPIEVPRITVAIATPFTERGEVDVDGIGRTASWLRSQGVGSIIPAGTTGEFAGMTAAERLTVLEATRQAAGNDCFLFANVSATTISIGSVCRDIFLTFGSAALFHTDVTALQIVG